MLRPIGIITALVIAGWLLVLEFVYPRDARQPNCQTSSVECYR